MSANTIAHKLYLAEPETPDPGNAKTIGIQLSQSVCNLVSAGAETRTLGRPEKQGIVLTLHMKTDGGDITLTVTGGFNEDGETTYVFSDPGQFLTLASFHDGTNYYWRKTGDYTTANISAAQAALLDGITATAAEINNRADESGNVVVLAATTVLTAADSGKTFLLSHATEFDTKLPAPALGLRFHFIVGLAPASANYTITTNGTTQNVIHGIVSSAEDAAGAGAGTSGTPVDVVTIVGDKAQVGDWVELICDGTLWYLRGACVQQDAITLA